MQWRPDIVAALQAPIIANLSPGVHLTKGFTMRQYQIRAAHKIFMGTPTRDRNTGYYIGPERDGTNVHIDMGLGKTIIGLTAIVDMFRFGICERPVLVIAPIRVCETVWAQEAAAWSHTRHLRIAKLTGDERDRAFKLARAYDEYSGTRNTDVLLINPEKLKWLRGYLKGRGDWGFFDALIIDDVAMKDPKSQQFKLVTDYGSRLTIKGPDGKALHDQNGNRVYIKQHRFKRAAKLTGTPSTNGLHNLWAPNYIMDHGTRLMREYGTFEARFFHKGAQVADHIYKVELNAEEGETRPLYEAKEGAPERIHELIADITIELNAADYGVLPKVMGDASKHDLDKDWPGFIHRIELPDDVRPKYDYLEKEAIIELNTNTAMAQNGGAKSMMCWQIANGALYMEDQYGRKEAQPVHDRKLDKLVDVIDMVNANVLIPYYFQHDFARITSRLDREGMAWASLKGRNTQRIVDRWNGGYTPILLIHPQSAAHGLNIQFGGHHLIWFTMLWSLERYLQTLARLARSGQANVVGNHHIVASRTTDDLMLLNLRQNGSDQERFRAAIREYQKIRGLDYINQGSILEGLL